MENETLEKRMPLHLKRSLKVLTGQILLKRKRLVIVVVVVTWMYMIKNVKMIQEREEGDLDVKDQKR